MGRTLENLEQFGIDVVLGRRRGFRAAVLRGILYGLSFIYERIVQLRLYLYRKRIFRERTAASSSALGISRSVERAKRRSWKNSHVRCIWAGVVLRS